MSTHHTVSDATRGPTPSEGSGEGAPLPHAPVTPEAVARFRTQGHIVLRGLLDPAIVDECRRVAESQLRPSGDGFGAAFARLRYDIEGQLPQRIVTGGRVSGVIGALVGESLTLTQCIGFELGVGQAGFEWHIGIGSFNYTMVSDVGYSLWIPLDPIRVEEQNGGMAWVGHDVHSGLPLYEEKQVLFLEPFDELSPEEIEEKCMGPLPEPVIAKLEANRVEEEFRVGDCLLFSKSVLHRSAELRSGPMSARRAMVLRFVGRRSRYNRRLLEAMNAAFSAMSKPFPSGYGYRFSELSDGQPLIDSPAFAGQPSIHVGDAES